MKRICFFMFVLMCASIITVGIRASYGMSMKIDCAGATMLINALERDSITDEEIDDLLRVHSVRAMVDNVTRFIPHIGITEFRKEIKHFVQMKQGGEYQSYFRFDGVWRERSNLRRLIKTIRANESEIIKETVSQLEPFRPAIETPEITVYFLVGGISGGFAFENDSGSIYANLVRAEGDYNGMLLNVRHEAYHAIQIAAQKRAGINALWVSNEKMTAVERLFTGTLSEGTANYVADPTRSTVDGVNIENARRLYQRNATPERIAKNFLLFDEVLGEIREKRMTWQVAYKKGFTSENDDSFYFVGYEMAKAIDRYCGKKCIGKLFEQSPIEFFRQYIALYKKHPAIKGRFSRETEAFIRSAAGGTK